MMLNPRNQIILISLACFIIVMLIGTSCAIILMDELQHRTADNVASELLTFSIGGASSLISFLVGGHVAKNGTTNGNSSGNSIGAGSQQ